MLPIAEAVLRELLGNDGTETAINEKTDDLENGESETKCTSFSNNPSYEPSDELDISKSSLGTDLKVRC